MAEWIHTTLGNIVDIQMGQSPKSEFYNTNGDGLPFLQGNRTFGMKYPFFDTYTTYIMKTAELNDIIMSVRAPVGDLNIAKNRICLGRGVCGLRMKNGEYEFLYYLLKANTVNILELETGTIFGSINKSDISKLIVTIPKDITKQKAIASVLSNLDDKIDLLHRQNKTLEAMAEAVFRQWFVEEADETWELTTIGKLIEVKGGSTPSTNNLDYWNGSINWITPRDLSNFTGIFVDDTERRITDIGLSKISSGLLPIGTVLLSSRAPIGYIAITNIPLAINQGFIAIIAKNQISNYFVYLWIKQNMDTILSIANGSTFLEVSNSNFKSLETFIIPKNLLLKFNKLTSHLFLKIKTIKNKFKL